MSKKNLLKTLDISSYVALVLGAILMVVFEFTAVLLLFKFSIILFASAFLMVTVLCSLKLVYIKNGAKEQEEFVVDVTKEKKSWIITKLVLYAFCFVIMLVFLCLF